MNAPCEPRRFPLALIVVAVLLAGRALGDDWPVFRGDALATGQARSELPAEPDVVWKHKVAKGSFSATATITADTVFVGDLNKTFWALDLATGARGASERIARLALEAEAPSFDNGELTDKATAASRIVLARRHETVSALHAPSPAPHVYVA